MYKTVIIILMIALLACQQSEKNKSIEDTKLGIIDAELESSDTHLPAKAKPLNDPPDMAKGFERSFENAPPLIPHTTIGFFPIKIENNICLSCHAPDKAEETGASSMPETHFSVWRPSPVETDEKFEIPDNERLTYQAQEEFNNAFFNCNQCHVQQTNVGVDIENLFTPEFRDEFGIKKSNLNKTVTEGI